MDDFSRYSDLALAVARSVIAEFGLDQRGLDDISVFNCVLKSIVNFEKESYSTSGQQKHGRRSARRSKK